MKLFGGKVEGGRSASAPGQWLRRILESRYRVPALILACTALVALAAVVVHAVLVRPPETDRSGLNDPGGAGAVKPAVSERPIATPPPEETPEGALPAAEENPPEESGQPSHRKSDVYTFVLLAFDQISGNTDTVLVGRLDTAEQRLDLVNIPRDTLVNVPWGVKKVNTILKNEDNDAERFKDHLSGLVGFRVDNCAVMNLRAVRRLVDAMGGVDYNLPRSMNYDDPSQDLHIHYSAGMQHLSGEDVVKVLRFRVGNDGSGYPDADLGRIRTQQDLLKSVASQFLRLGNIPNLGQAIEIFQEEVETDLTANNLMFFAEQFLLLDSEDIRFYTAPGSGISIRGGSYYELDIDAWLEVLNEALNPYTLPVTGSNLDVVRYLGSEGAISTSGETLALSSFQSFPSGG